MYQHVDTYQGEEERTVRKCDGDLSDLGVRESIPSETVTEMDKRVESRWGREERLRLRNKAREGYE